MNPQMFTHYLITRFNLKRDDWMTSKNGSLVLTEEWLNNRFRLFEQFCLPSVQNQTNLNFIWLVFFDSSTPTKYREKVTHYSRQFPNFKPVYINGMQQFLPAIQTEIKKTSSQYIITTRMDNDDCISKNFINEIQQNFNQQNYEAIDFSDGYTLQIKPEVKAGKRKQVYNPFITLIEKNDNPKSVWSRETHSSWKKVKQVKRISDKRVWMSVIHFENKKNEFAGYGTIDLNKLFDDFLLDEDIQWNLIHQKKGMYLCMQSFQNRISSYWRTFYKDIKRSLGLYK